MSSKRYNWQEIQTHYDAGHSVRECSLLFGFSLGLWSLKVKAGIVKPRPISKIPWQVMLTNSGKRQDYCQLKRALIESGREYKCEDCGVPPDWNGKPLTLQIHHVNGDSHNHEPTNLKFLCPNCHSQTDNYGNKQKRESSRIYRRARMVKLQSH